MALAKSFKEAACVMTVKALFVRIDENVIKINDYIVVYEVSEDFIYEVLKSHQSIA